MNDDAYTSQMKAATLSMIDYKCKVVDMTTYTALRETLRTVQAQYEELSRETLAACVKLGVPGLTADQQKSWAETCAEVARRLKDATP